MDVYQKLLVKIYEEAGGKESENVDFTDLVKREGFYPSITSILDHFLSQIWITQGSGKNVRLTHWGVQEAKKLQTSTPVAAAAKSKETNSLIAETREFVALLEEFNSNNSPEDFEKAYRKFSELKTAIENLKTAIK